MSTKITADNGVELEVCHLGIDATNPNPTEPSSIWARLTAEQRTKLAAALAPERTPILEGRPVHEITVTGYVGDATINPADCDRTTVYTGECRNFADTEWIRFDSGRRRSPDTSDGNTWLIDVAYGSFWMADDKVRNLAPLVPAPTGGQWTRADLPSAQWLHDTFYDEPDDVMDALERIAVALMDHLNAHHPKVGMEARLDAEAAGAEMTAAYAARAAAEARATLAEQERENWRVTAINRAAPVVSRGDIEERLRIAYESGNHPIQRIRLATDNMCALLGVETESQTPDPVEELAGQIERSAHEAIQSVVDALNRIGVPVDMSALLAGVDPDHWRTMARRVLAEDGGEQ